MVRLLFWWFTFLLLATITPSAFAQASFSFTPGAPIIVPLSWQGQNLHFVVDTGASYTAFDSRFEKKLGTALKSEQMKTAGGLKKFNIYPAQKAQLGDMAIDQPVVSLDLQPYQGVLGQSIDGLLGMNFLKQHAIAIDFDNGRITFLKTSTKRTKDWGPGLEMAFTSRGNPFITATPAHEDAQEFLIDTGANGSGKLTKAMFDKIRNQKQTQTHNILIETPVGVIHSQVIRISQLTLGKTIYPGLIFDHGPWFALGLDFLARHQVLFDFPNAKLYLKPGKLFKQADQADMSGLHLLRLGERTVVHSVDQGSPAYRAGMRSGDTLLTLDNQPTHKLNIFAIRALLKSRDGRVIQMTIKRGETVKEMSFKLKKML